MTSVVTTINSTTATLVSTHPNLDAIDSVACSALCRANHVACGGGDVVVSASRGVGNAVDRVACHRRCTFIGVRHSIENLGG